MPTSCLDVNETKARARARAKREVSCGKVAIAVDSFHRAEALAVSIKRSHVAVTEHSRDDRAAERTRRKVQELMIAAGIVMGDAGINGCSRGSRIRCFHYARGRCRTGL